MAKGSYIGQVQIGDNTYPVGSILYGTASYDTTNNYWAVNNNNLTTTTFTNDNLTTGVTIHIKFNAINSADTPKLKVGAATEKAIVKYGTTNVGKSAATSWVANSIVSFTYDGTSWVMNTGIDTDTTYAAATTNPINIGTTALGLSTAYARADHVHDINVNAGTNNGEIVIAGHTVTPTGLAEAAYKQVETTLGANSANLPTSQAVANYVSSVTSGLTGAMHFKGVVNSLPDATDTTTYSTYSAGDVILVDEKEYVYNKHETSAANSSWVLLGDEGSYALKSNTAECDDITNWATNTPSSASVLNGTLTIINGSAAVLNHTSRTVVVPGV